MPTPNINDGGTKGIYVRFCFHRLIEHLFLLPFGNPGRYPGKFRKRDFRELLTEFLDKGRDPRIWQGVIFSHRLLDGNVVVCFNKGKQLSHNGTD